MWTRAGDRMWAVWLRVRAGLRQDWRGPVVLALITGLMGAVVLVALAGARRTDTAVSRFLQYAGPAEGEVAASSRIYGQDRCFAERRL